MKTLILLATLLSLSSYAMASVPENHCAPQVDSKTYRSGDFHSAYPRTVVFACNYFCRAGGKLLSVQGTTTVRVHNMEEDASLVVCQGILVKKVAWGYDFDRVQPFYAFDTKIKEIKQFAFSQLTLKNDTEVEYLLHLKKNLEVVIRSYSLTNHQEFNEAARRLEKIREELPFKTSTLDKYVKKISEQQGHLVLEAQAESLVLSTLSSLAHWRLPHHLF